MIHQKTRTYRIIYQYKDAWKPESFRERYSEVLDPYDYIVGDWGYNQLRLKGFYRPDNPKATKETSIAYLQDYLHEYCNFGCAYFVIERVDPSDRFNLDLDRSETSITITELPPSQRYAEWQAFLQKLREQREQEKENGEERPARRQNRPQAGAGDAPGAAAGARRSEPAASGRPESGGRPVKLHAAEPHGRPGGRSADGGFASPQGGAGGNGSDAGRPAGPPARPTDRGPAAPSRQEIGAAGESRPAGKPGHKRPWHRNRKNRHHGKGDRPRHGGPEPKNRAPDGSAAGEPT